MIAKLLAILILTIGSPIAAQTTTAPDGNAILLMAREAQGGDGWANAKTLQLSGHAVFYGSNGPEPRSTADDYRMWRIFDPDREVAHGAAGKVRISAKSKGRILFDIGFDGNISWNERGIVPKAEADLFWANNFGFGIIRQAGKPGFSAIRLPDDSRDGHALYMVELTDPNAGKTLFGIDQTTNAIRYMGFTTARGWHERLYDDFIRLSNPDWLQARRVTLYYDGRKTNEVFWDVAIVDASVDEQLFTPPNF
ncbi:MAG: hypothetical protein U5J78_07115 [Parasphingorhabdus sp.]|nr:hypothetical protein [Parasphingorhabdus sp.]